jgi:hypothetical protein
MTSMNSSTTYASDRTFPYVLICSTFGAILSLAAVWISAAATYTPGLVA